MKKSHQTRLIDCVFLFAMVSLSAFPYLPKLGLYSDDWGYQAEISQHADLNSFALFQYLVGRDADLRVRPVQTAYMVLCSKVLKPSGPVHAAVGIAWIGIAVLLLYAVLRELRLKRSLALAIASLYGMLPHYSSVRFWFSSQQSILCMVFALAGIYAMLRSIRPAARYPSYWISTSIVFFILSFLCYEVAVGMIVASIAAVLWRRYREARASGRGLAAIAGMGATVGVLLIVGVIKIRMQSRIVYNHHFMRFLGRLGGMAVHAGMEALQFNFWAYLLHMPAVVAILWRHSALSATAIAVAAVIACAVSIYLWWTTRMDGMSNWHTYLWLIAAGFALFFLGIMLFVRDTNSDFASPGQGNRICIAAALGAAVIQVALTGLLCLATRWRAVRAPVFSVLVGVACGLNSLVVSGIGYYWDDAAARQDMILQSVKANVRGLPQKSVLMLDGFCRYTGPAPVFESDWDAAGAIQITLGDFTLGGDVISPNAHFGAAFVDTTMYGEPEGHYSYGDRLFAYNIRNRRLYGLESRQAAITYLKNMNPTQDNGCPPELDGAGVEFF